METTYITEVYDYFLSSITDYTLLDERLTEEELNEDLFTYFKKARARFYKCKQSLKLIENENTNKYFVSSNGEPVKLTDFEILIITHLMLVEFIKPQLLSSEVLRQQLSDKDFKIYSQANQLRELNLLYRLLQKESNKMITEYTYLDLGDKNL